MGFDIRHQRAIAAPPDLVWGLLADFSTWPRWWPDCSVAQRQDRTPLAEGSRIEMVLSPGGRERTLVAEVDLLSEGRSLTIVAQRFLFKATATWILREGPAESSRLAVHGAFSGLGAGRLGIGEALLESTLKRHARGLGQAAERLA